MTWSQLYPQLQATTFDQIQAYIHSTFYEQLVLFLEQTYQIKPKLEYSGCSMIPGWNIKYKKKGKAVCTLYPAPGYVTCMLVLSEKLQIQAELFLQGASEPVRQAYWQAKPLMGNRWLVLDVHDQAVLDDIKGLIQIKMQL